MNREVAEVVDLHHNGVAILRQRFGAYGLTDLGDLERRGRPHVYNHDDMLSRVKLVAHRGQGGPWRADLGHKRWLMAESWVANGHGHPHLNPHRGSTR